MESLNMGVIIPFFTMVLNILTFFSGSQILTIRMDTLHWHHSQPKLGFLDTKSALSCTWWHTCCFSTSSNILFVGLALVLPKKLETKMVVLFWVWRNLRLDMQTVLACGAQHVLNCSVHSTWTDEDFIGRISRISRRSHVLTAARNTLQRALGHYRRQFGSFFDPVYLRDS